MASQIKSIKAKYGLNDKQWEFVIKYIEHEFNGTEAALAVYTCKNRASASVRAHKLLRTGNILKAIKEEFKTHMAVFGLRKSDIINEMITIAFCDQADYLDVDDKGTVSLKNIKKIGMKSKAIKQVKIKDTLEGQDVEFKLGDKEKMLDCLAKMNGLYDGNGEEEKTQINVNVSLFEKKDGEE